MIIVGVTVSCGAAEPLRLSNRPGAGGSSAVGIWKINLTSGGDHPKPCLIKLILQIRPQLATRIRVGDYRIVYSVDDGEAVIDVIGVPHEGYDGL